ncbi:MAG TPA: extracellular solute-binding protein, partial [Limnochordia bacterium]
MRLTGHRGRFWFHLRVYAAAALLVAALALPAAAATHEILFSYNASGEEEGLLKEVVAEFVAAHPGTNVRTENIVGPHGSQWFDQLLVRLASGVDAPDVYLMELNKALGLISRNRIMPLDALIKRDGTDIADLVPAGLQGVVYQGRIYGLPSRVDAAMFYANMELLARAGLNLPKNDWTLDEFRRAAGQMTQDINGDRVADVWGVEISSVRFLFAAWQTIFGGKILDADGEVVLDEPANVNALEAVLELVSGYQVAPNPAAIPRGVGFPQGNVGFWYHYTFQIRSLREQAAHFNWDILPQPVGPAGPGNILLGNMFMIDSQTKEPDLAWEL